MFANHQDLLADDCSAAINKVFNRDRPLALVTFTVKTPTHQARHMEDGLAHCFAGNRSCMYACSAQHTVAFDQSDRLAQFCGLYGSLLPGWSTANDRHVN